MNPIRVAVVGAGSMGRLHARAVARRAARDGDCVLAAILDPHPERSRAVSEEFGGAPVARLADLADVVDAVVVAVPTRAHDEIARGAIAMDLDVLIEKPLSGSLDEARKTVALAADRGRVLGVGHVEWHNMRIRRAVEEVGPLRLIDVERLNPPLERGLDIDVVQDFMLHDLDWIRRSVDHPASEVEACGRAVRNDRLDEAEAQIDFGKECRARLRVDRLHETRVRRIRLEGSRGVRSIDLLAASPDLDGAPGSGVEAPPDPEPLDLEWADFLKACRERKAPENDGAVGLAAIELVDRVRAAIARGEGERADDPALGG